MPVGEGDRVVLIGADGTTHLVRAGEPLRDGDSVLPTSAVVGAEPGARISLLGSEFTVAHPVWRDALDVLKRGPQIIVPETAAQIVHLAGISPGSRVVEGGTGTGCATIVLASHVGETGHVDTFDLRESSTDLARANIELAGFAGRVDFHSGDVTDCPIVDADAMVLDVPEPWGVLSAAIRVLRPGGYLVAYLPTTTQVERLMRSFGQEFTAPTCRESINREWELSKSDEGLRPSFTGPAHSGFLVTARRI